MRLAQLESIRVVIAEENPNLRKGLVTALRQAGMKNVLATGDLTQVLGTIEANHVDLIIGSTDALDGKFNKCIFDLRHRHIGDNPFIVVMTLIADPTTETVRDAMDAGPDHLLAKPIDFDVLIKQITDLTLSRKPFVVTADYIGPDRRTKARPGTQVIQKVEVPNPLRQRMTGQMRETTLKRAIESVWGLINEQKVERHTFQISWLLDRIVPMVAANESHSDEFEKLAERLVVTAKDMSNRIANTRYSHISAMSTTLATLSEASRKNQFQPEDLRLLIKLSELISDCVEASRDLADLSVEEELNILSMAKVAATA